MSTSPRVSIVMGTFNRAHMIGRAIEALQQQTFTDWELIIADDASHDDTPATVASGRRASRGLSRFATTSTRGSRATTIRRSPWPAASSSRCSTTTTCGASTTSSSGRSAFLEAHPDHVGCGGGLIAVNTEGRELYRFMKPQHDDKIRRSMLFSNPMANSTTLFRRVVGEQVAWYDASMRYSGDRDFWMKMALRGKLHNFPEYLGYYTTGDHNTSIRHIKPHLKASLMLTSRYRKEYPNYLPALALNYAQYWYGCLPDGIRQSTHTRVIRAKRAMA